jgi:(5-formylfuran-3-yl)methyl phosphate synthase
VLADVLAALCGRVPVSAALGEMPADAMDLPADLAALSFVKCGLAGWRVRAKAWQDRLLQLREQVETGSSCRLAAVAYADWKLAEAPSVLDVARFAVRHRWSALLVDTWRKGGSTLLDWMSLTELEHLRRQTRAVGVKLALAGSLSEATIQDLMPLAPDWFAVRGAACAEQRRGGKVQRERVRQLVKAIESSERHTPV